MKNIFIAIFCIVIVFFQLSVEGVFFGQQRIPDLALALVITLILAAGFEKSIGWILLTGGLLDMGTRTIFGTTALVFLLIGWAISSLAAVTDIRSKKMFFLILLACIAAIAEIIKDLAIVESTRIGAYYLQNTTNLYAVHFNVDYFLKIFYTILATYAVYYIFRRMSRFLFFESIKLAKTK